MGLEATPKNLNDLKLQKAAEAKRLQELLDEAQVYAKKIEEITVKLTIKAGEGGRTFGAISTKDISSELKEQFGYDVDKKKLQLAEPIKNIGSYSIPIKLHPQVTAELKVNVSST